MTFLNNAAQYSNSNKKENYLLDEKSLSNISKKLDLTLSTISQVILKKENLESNEEPVPIGVMLDVERNKYALINMYQRLINAYPVKTEFSEEEKSSMALVCCNDPNQLSMNKYYIHFPWFNWRISSEMDSMIFTVGDEELSRLELELGVIYENGQFLEGYTTHKKLDLEFQELKQAIESNSHFEHRRDSLLFQQYKIHFMPKPKYFSRCVIKLIKTISEDTILKSHLHCMKVAIDPYEDFSQVEHRPPSIVVYPILSKTHAEQALAILFDHFKSDGKMGSHQNPRFNVETKNGLITYAQGDGYKKIKTLTKYPKLFSKMFESNGAHFNAKFGSFHLAVPENF